MWHEEICVYVSKPYNEKKRKERKENNSVAIIWQAKIILQWLFYVIITM